MKVYSPSQTTLFLESSMKWALSGDYETRKVDGRRDFARVLGAGFAAGMAKYNEWRRDTVPTPTQCPGDTVDAAVAAAIDCVGSQMLEFEGREIGERDAAQRASILPRVERAVKKAIGGDPIPPDWKVITVETTLGEAYGWVKPDLVVCDPRGVAPFDYKLKLAIRGKSPDERAWNKEQLIADYARSWQMYHYVWALSHGGQLVNHYYIALTVLEPSFGIDLFPYEVDPESLAQWEKFAWATWERMERIEEGLELPVCAMGGCGSQYGPCEFQKLCWEFHYDWELAKFDYVRRRHRVQVG